MTLSPVAQRFAYDDDGTVVKRHSTGVALTTLEKQTINNESNDALAAGTDKIVFIFPGSKVIYGIYVACNGVGIDANVVVETSSDTTTGLDGTWTAVTLSVGGGPIPSNNNVSVPDTFADNYIATVNALGKAIRVTYGTGAAASVAAIHFYGYEWIVTVPRLMIQMVLDEDDYTNTTTPVWVNTPQSAGDGLFESDGEYLSPPRWFLSLYSATGLTAHDVTVTVEALTDPVPPGAAQYLLSLDGETWVAELSLPDFGVADDYESVPFYVRRFSPHDAAAGNSAARLVADCSGIS